ncbi:hypothetical protein FJV76_31045 [Mesorhizobium sp. WSM4303]|uniref:hypothetical protein n=1 Tax=unclassified Mesorhizobium TaxID=325217 RepID=UPI00115D136D|nr:MULTISPECIES: hypothetical protein [unclassified Mesorhizobium]TRC87850.1 hypothetical protein FJV77_30750 [Mesorhizobium sp. WSM4306]TRC94017.1 hypothetical protein FJV76_31045 [Mesorhizobium sp. WSM4303]
MLNHEQYFLLKSKRYGLEPYGQTWRCSTYACTPLGRDDPRNAARTAAYESHTGSIVLPRRISKYVINLDVLPTASNLAAD